MDEKPLHAITVKFLTGPLKDRVFPVSKKIVTIGSDAKNDIVIPDDAGISSFHARFFEKDGSWYIERHPQAGTIRLNKRSVEQAELTEKALVELGEATSFLVFAVEMELTSTQVSEDQTTMTLEHADGFIAKAGGSRPSPAVQGGVNPVTQPGSPEIAKAGESRPSPAASRPDQTVIAPLSAMGIPTFEISSNTSNEKRSYALDKAIINIGRNADNDIVINNRSVSGYHVQIVRQGNTLVLVHPHPARQQTLNGLLYQGRKIRGDEHYRKVLAQGDFFRIGNENGTFVTLTYNDGRTEQREELPPIQPIKLQGEEITIGRIPGNTVVLAHPQVSAHHARLVREGGTYRIFDLNSTNHVYVNAQLVTDHLLKMGDEIRIGPYRLVFESTQLTEYDESNYIRIDALNLKRYNNKHVTLLDNISLSIAPRKFVAVVGGSGTGKSTLIKALSGLQPAQEGQVLYNGQDYYRNLAAFNTQLGYVPQDDIVHRDLTVERALYYAAKLRLPRDFTQEQIRQRIAEVLDDVELTGREKQLVRNLSGGQRKRVSIALELLAHPSLFFLDEPTSGLDPGLDRKMMFLLRKLADKGHTVILVTHATNNINTCDYVCFLAPGGRLAYFGPPEAAKAFFGKDDFAEIYSSLEPTEQNQAVPEQAELRFRTSNDYQTYVAQPLKALPTALNVGAGFIPARGAPTTKNAGAESIPTQGAPTTLNAGAESIPTQGTPTAKNAGSGFTPARGAPAALNVGAGFIPARRTNGRIPLKKIKPPKRGNPFKQFGLLCMRHFELLKNNVSNLSILLLQAPLVALLLMLLVRFEIGVGIFDPINVAGCSPQIPTPSGPLVVSNAGNAGNSNAPIDCSQVVSFLKSNPNGIQYVQSRANGDVNKALQDFILPQGGDAQRMIFLVSFFAVVFGCINGSREIVKEAAIYQRERAVNLGLLPYLSSKIAILGILSVLQSASILLIAQLFEPFHQGVFLPVQLEIFLSIALVGLAGVMMGLAISAASPNDDTANSLLPIVIIPQVIFAGSIIPLKDWFTQLAAALFPMRWAMTALGSSIGLHSDKIDQGKLFGSDPVYHGTLFSIYSQADATQRIVLSWVAMGLIIVLMIALTAIFLKQKDARG